MKKLLVAVFFTVVFSLPYSSLHAQRLFFVALHGNYNQPAGSVFSNAYNFGLGADAVAGVGWGKTFVTGTVGYNFFKASSGYKNGGNISSSFIKGGLRQYIFAKILYVKADAGVAYTTNKLNNASGFTGDAGFGAKLAGFDLGLDINTLHYELVGLDKKWNSWIGFKAGWHFGL